MTIKNNHLWFLITIMQCWDDYCKIWKVAMWYLWEWEYRQTLFSAQYVKNVFTHGDLSRVADGFSCRRCDGTIQEADLAEDLMVDRETYECVKSFCYLGDTLDGDGGADFAATARIIN